MADDPSPAADLAASPTRRSLLAAGSALAAAAALPGCALLPVDETAAVADFKAVPPSTTDRVFVPEGYAAEPLARWGDAVGIAEALPAWRNDAGNPAAEQALQIGQQICGVQYLALDGSNRGLLVLGHGLADEGALHAGGAQPWTAEKMRKSQAAVGLSVVEVERQGAAWQLVQPAAAARRITATTPVALAGPAAGHALLRTAADPGGRRVLGVLGIGAVALTPWGTCLAGEQGWAEVFATADQPTAHERRYGLGKAPASRWFEHDTRYDTVRHPNEPNRFGWLVEFDPGDPSTTPVKRSALGRGMRSAVAVALAPDRRAIVYLADGAPFEPLARFVSREPVREGGAAANATLLDEGTLQLARFDADGSGRWLPLVHGSGPLTRGNGFADAGELLVKTRQAAELLGATRTDRAAALAVDPASGWVHAAMAGNPQRGTPGFAAVDAANPRPHNLMGHLLRWRESAEAERFEWALGPLAGHPASARPELQGKLRGDAFAVPASLARDPRGLFWIGTAAPSAAPPRGELAHLGNNVLLAYSPADGETRRFLTGPVNGAIAGASFTPDGSTLFVAVQHPGEAPGQRSDPAEPRRFSNWPDFNPIGRPRSAVLAVRRLDGGPIGR